MKGISKLKHSACRGCHSGWALHMLHAFHVGASWRVVQESSVVVLLLFACCCVTASIMQQKHPVWVSPPPWHLGTISWTEKRGRKLTAQKSSKSRRTLTAASASFRLLGISNSSWETDFASSSFCWLPISNFASFKSCLPQWWASVGASQTHVRWRHGARQTRRLAWVCNSVNYCLNFVLITSEQDVGRCFL